MAGNRWVLSVIVSAGLAALPACAIHLGTKVTDDETAGQTVDTLPMQVTQSPPGATDFAAYPRRPGEHVPLRPDVPDVPVVTGRSADDSSEPLPLPKVIDAPPLQPAPPPDPPFVAAVREYANDRPDRAVEHLKALEPVNQELLLQLIPVVVRAGQAPLSKASPHDVGVMAAELESAHASLANKIPLFVEKACFCRDVKNYGRYVPFPERHAFQPGRLILLYTEVRNAPSEPATAPTGVEGYVTRLAWALQIRDAAGNVVPLPGGEARPSVPELQGTKEEFARSPMKDYFLTLQLTVPPKSGAYTVRFEVRDPKTGRAVSKTMPLRVQ